MKVYLACLAILLAKVANAVEIRQQNLDMAPPARGNVQSEQLLVDEIPEVEATHIAITGPARHTARADEKSALIVLVLAGQAELEFQGEQHSILSETIAVPIDLDALTLDVPEGEALHCLVIRKAYNAQDLADMPGYAHRKAGGIYLRRFSECEAYREAIKSPKTVSRTVLPAQYIPRVAMGTVETTGPDQVGAHRHPMLDQLFLGLAGNDVVVTADGTNARMSQFALLHIPLGSLHGVQVETNRKLYYMWMDFFLTKEGEEWLKTHKPITE